MRVEKHPILGHPESQKKVTIYFDGRPLEASLGEPILATLLAHGIKITHYTKKSNQPRGLFCGIGRCTDCVMIVNGIPNVRTCITPVEEGMTVETQQGTGSWQREND